MYTQMIEQAVTSKEVPVSYLFITLYILLLLLLQVSVCVYSIYIILRQRNAVS